MQTIKYLIITFLIFLALFSFAQDWPMVGGNPGRTSFATNEVELYPPLEKEKDIPVYGEFIIEFEDILYTANGGSPNTIEAYDLSTEQVLWTFELPETAGSIGVVPAVSGNQLFCGGQHGEGLYALDRLTGEINWLNPIGSLFNRNPVVDNKGRVYILADSLYCFDVENGETLWSYFTQGYATPTYHNGTVYISSSSYITALNSVNGEQIWKKAHGYGSNGHVLADGEDVIFCQGNTIYSYYPEDGREKWYYQLDENAEIAAYGMGSACLSNKVVAISLSDDGNGQGKLLVLDRFSGQRLWDYTADYQYIATPTALNGTILLAGGIFNWFFRVFDEINGESLFEDVNLNYSSQPIVANERIFIPTNTGIRVFKNKSSSIISKSSNELKLCVFPNPASDKLFVRYPNHRPGKININLIDEQGLPIESKMEHFRFIGNHLLEIDLSILNAGTYFLLLESGEEYCFKSFVVIK